MIKIIRTDLFRLFRSKAFYSFPIFIVLIITLSSFFSASKVDKTDESAENEEGLHIEISIESEQKEQNNSEAQEITTKISVLSMAEKLADGSILIFVGIILIIFCTSETRAGFIKNSASAVSDRGLLAVSKILVGMVMTIIYLLEHAVLTVLLGFIFSLFGAPKLEYVPIPAGEGFEVFRYAVLAFLANMAIITILVFMHELTRNRALGVIAALCFAGSIFENLTRTLVGAVQDAFGILEGFDIAKYMLFPNLAEGYKADAYNPTIVLVLSLIYILIFGILAMTVSRKKEVR